MKNLPLSRLLGIALIAGGAIIGSIMMILMSNYASEGKFTPAGATIGVIASFILLVLPQIGLGIYFIWYDTQETAVTSTATQIDNSSENSPSPE